MSVGFNKSKIAFAVATALSAAAIGTASGNDDSSRFKHVPKTDGTYVTGDFHNHTTCSDGSISMQKLVSKSMDKTDAPWGLDWFVQAGHGGSGNRNCTLAEDASLATPAYPLVYAADGTTIQGPSTTWQNTNPSITPKGRVQGTAPNQVMWRWQSIQEYQYPQLEYLSALKNVPLFMGMESVVAGHEHTSMSIITGQIPGEVFTQKLPKTAGYAPLGNANALSQWSYCFDRGDTDTSRGNTTTTSGFGNNWECSVDGSPNSIDPALGWNPEAQKILPPSGPGVGIRGHLKTVESMKWMSKHHEKGSFYVPAHLERAGPFNPDGNNGFNIEHLRNFHNAAPTVAFGMETQPGHHASDARGEYTIRRNNIAGVNVDSVGGTTYGGTGVYGAQVGGVWDALLGEGRNFWFFASSDWHNRGMFGPDDRRSTQDFYPGEYQRDFVMVSNKDGKGHHYDHWDKGNGRDKGKDKGGDKDKGKSDLLTPQAIVDGLRTGNSFTTTGQVIDRLAFVACVSSVSNPKPFVDGLERALVESAAVIAATKNTDVDADRRCATMGEKLEVRKGQDIIVSIVVRDPSTTNYSPYSFANPSLLQVGIKQPLNAPVLDHIDVINGLVTGYKVPGAADYAGQWPNDWIVNPDLSKVPEAAKNTSAEVIRTFNSKTWSNVHGDKQYKKMTFRIPAVAASQYLRLRGTNLPASVNFETDADGNPLADLYTNSTGVNPKIPGGTDSIPANAHLKIPCTTTGTNVPDNATVYGGKAIDGCPAHLPVIDGQKYSAVDVAAWADLWFYSNPIFIEVKGSTIVAGVK